MLALKQGEVAFMEASISVADKKIFLEWFIGKFPNQEINWFIEDMLLDDEKLNHIHFVEYLDHYKKGLKIVVKDGQSLEFYFKKGLVKSHDIYTAFHELQMNKDEAFYLQIDLPQEDRNQLLYTVLEMNATEKQQLAKETKRYLNQLTKAHQKKQLKEKINHALDIKDEQAFRVYAQALMDLKNARS